jgi:predicted AAA+ superfamily ATPase
LADRLRQAANAHPVVVLTGARQVGKSTLLRNEPPSPSWRQHTLDDLDVLRQAEREPEALWAGTAHVVIDEAQRAPDILLAVRRTIDRDRNRRFVLSGSASLGLLSSVSETLAGRAVSIPLGPMTWGEWREDKPSRIVENLLTGNLPAEGNVPDRVETLALIPRGFMPALLRLTGKRNILDWWSGYVSTYLERDLRALSQISSLPDFRRVMELAALRTGQLMNQTEVSRDSGVSQPTVHRYLNLLEASFLIHRVPAFARNRGKRLIKSAKLYWTDAALAPFLAGHYDEESLRTSREAGGLFENLVLQQLQVAASLMSPQARIQYWRTAAGQEVDFVLEWGRSLVAFECKLSDRPRFEDARSLHLFLSDYPECACGVVVHTGSDIVRLGEQVIALPWTTLGVGT